MTAIIRIKRNCSEDPLDAVLINCKKRKVDESTTEIQSDVSTVLNFAGTVTDSDDDVLKYIQRLTKSDAEEQYKKHKIDITNKLRFENRVNSVNSRYKIINSHRFSTPNLETNEDTDLNCTIVDVEAAEKNRDENESTTGNYVYDLYYTNSDDFGETDLNEFISVYPLSEGLVYGSARDNGYHYSESDNSEDSNAENHWKNDYPDESDVEDFEDPYEDDSIDEDATDAMKKVSLRRNEDLSSDDFEDDYNDCYNCDESCTP
ncbi:hypothetical protein RN001_007798 [Aquatica leii]|uniref:Probable RNA polymerase II nuclear localization protein SLC7A6OS n=1 Tax=Aquatica leii TaxID=1421715 RepID=A0AAN7PYH6_9COLE|nr:hypothetical protein RN001_007798 [Aquatica leii]